MEIHQELPKFSWLWGFFGLFFKRIWRVYPLAGNIRVKLSIFGSLLLLDTL